jgi:hypothetical protein
MVLPPYTHRLCVRLLIAPVDNHTETFTIVLGICGECCSIPGRPDGSQHVADVGQPDSDVYVFNIINAPNPILNAPHRLRVFATTSLLLSMSY